MAIASIAKIVTFDPNLNFFLPQADVIDGTDQNNTINASLLDPNVAYVIHGNGGDDILTGGNLNDTLDGGTGNDIMNGGAGNDLFIGGAGNDTMFGGSGIDTVTYASSTSAVNLSLFASGEVFAATGQPGVGGTLGDALGDKFVSIDGIQFGVIFDRNH